MDPKESSISIINKNNGALTGEKAQALPIKLVTSHQNLKWFMFGFFTCLVIALIVLYFAKRGVNVINVEEKASQYTEYSI